MFSARPMMSATRQEMVPRAPICPAHGGVTHSRRADEGSQYGQGTITRDSRHGKGEGRGEDGLLLGEVVGSVILSCFGSISILVPG